MAKWIVYLWPVPQEDDSSEQPCLQLIRSPITDDTREQMIERITAIAYNGEYTIEDDGKPEPVIPPTNEELAADNKLLKQQVSALTDQQSFYEDCIAEMAEVVYA